MGAMDPKDYGPYNPQGYGLCPHGMSGRVYCGQCSAEDRPVVTPKSADRLPKKAREALGRALRALDDGELDDAVAIIEELVDEGV